MGVQEQMARACELGLAIEDILADTSLQRLSKPAWLRECLTLGDFADVDTLEAARAKLVAAPYLSGEVERTAAMWVRDFQPDPPSHWLYGDARGDRAAGYAERLALGLTVDEVSAVTAYIAAERAPESFFGRLNDRDEPQRLLAPLRAELEVLDDQLAAELRVRDIAWEPAGATLRAGSVAVALTATTAVAPASALAQAARDHARVGQLAA